MPGNRDDEREPAAVCFEICCQVRIVNREGIEKFHEGIELIEEVLQDSPWLEELRDALECLRRARDGLIIREVD